MNEATRKIFQFEDGTNIWFAIDKCVTSQDMLKALVRENGGSITDAVINADFYLVSSWKSETQKTAEGITAEGGVAIDSPWVFESVMAKKLLPWYPYQVRSLSPYQTLSDEGRDLREMALCLGRYRPIVSEDNDIYRFLHMKFPHRTSSQFAHLHHAHDDQVNACALRLHSLFSKTTPPEEFFTGSAASLPIANGSKVERTAAAHTRNQSQTSVDMQSSTYSPVDLPSLTYSVQTIDTPSPHTFGRDSGRFDRDAEQRVSISKPWDSTGNYVIQQPEVFRSSNFYNEANDPVSPTGGVIAHTSSQITAKKPSTGKMEVGSRRWSSGNIPPSSNDPHTNRRRTFTQFEIDHMIQWIIDHPISEKEDKKKYWANFTANSPVGPNRLSKVWQRHYTKYLLPQLSQQKDVLDAVSAAPYPRRRSFYSDASPDAHVQNRSRIDQDEDSDADEYDESYSNMQVYASEKPTFRANRFKEEEVEEMLKWIQTHPISADEDIRKYWENFVAKAPIGPTRKASTWRAKYTRHIKPRLAGEPSLPEQAPSSAGNPFLSHSKEVEVDEIDSSDEEMRPTIQFMEQHTRVSDSPFTRQVTTPLSGPAGRSTMTPVSTISSNHSSVPQVASTGDALATLSTLAPILDPISMRQGLQKISPIEWGDYFDRVHEEFALKCYGIPGLALEDIIVWKQFANIHPAVRQDPKFWLSRYKSQKKYLESKIASNPPPSVVTRDNQDNLPTSNTIAPMSDSSQNTPNIDPVAPPAIIDTDSNVVTTVSTVVEDPHPPPTVQEQALPTQEIDHVSRPEVSEVAQTSTAIDRVDTITPSIIFHSQTHVTNRSTGRAETEDDNMDTSD